MNNMQMLRLPPYQANHYASHSPVSGCRRKAASMLKPLMVGQDEALAGPVQRTSSARWALVALCLTMLLSSLGTSIANVGLPSLAQAFNASFQAVQWVVIAYLLAITTLVVSVGRLGDVTGRRRLLLAP